MGRETIIESVATGETIANGGGSIVSGVLDGTGRIESESDVMFISGGERRGRGIEGIGVHRLPDVSLPNHPQVLAEVRAAPVQRSPIHTTIHVPGVREGKEEGGNN